MLTTRPEATVHVPNAEVFDVQRFDTVIRHGTVATASDVMQCDVGITGGRIVALGQNLAPAQREIDARGRLVLPGGVDWRSTEGQTKSVSSGRLARFTRSANSANSSFSGSRHETASSSVSLRPDFWAISA